MKNFLGLLFCFAVLVSCNEGDVYVKGYYRKDGTYVQSHYRTSPDGSTANNYSSSSNHNVRVGLLLLPIVLVGLAFALKDNKQK